MGFALLGLLAGIVLPIQTGVNTKLREKIGTSERSACVSFVVGTLFLILVLLITGSTHFLVHGENTWWVWIGGSLGVVFLVGNLYIYPYLGGTMTVILPAAGQIFMGLMVDHFGWFQSEVQPMTILRAAGAALVLLGVVINSIDNTGETVKRENNNLLWALSIVGIAIGMISAAQTAINARLGIVLENPVQAATVSFALGAVLLILLCILPSQRKAPYGNAGEKKGPAWIWLGGILGVAFVLTNLYVAGKIGTGMAVIASLTGTMIGGIVIDHLGILGAEKKPVTMQKIGGTLLVLAGAVMVRLL